VCKKGGNNARRVTTTTLTVLDVAVEPVEILVDGFEPADIIVGVWDKVNRDLAIPVRRRSGIVLADGRRHHEERCCAENLASSSHGLLATPVGQRHPDEL